LINQQNALVLDVREAADYEKGHMLNARNIASESSDRAPPKSRSTGESR